MHQPTNLYKKTLLSASYKSVKKNKLNKQKKGKKGGEKKVNISRNTINGIIQIIRSPLNDRAAPIIPCTCRRFSHATTSFWDTLALELWINGKRLNTKIEVPWILGNRKWWYDSNENAFCNRVLYQAKGNERSLPSLSSSAPCTVMHSSSTFLCVSQHVWFTKCPMPSHCDLCVNASRRDGLTLSWESATVASLLGTMTFLYTLYIIFNVYAKRSILTCLNFCLSTCILMYLYHSHIIFSSWIQILFSM